MKSITTYAPGRAELLGNHTDYNEGYVLAIAVDQGTTLTGRVLPDRILRLHSREMGKSQEISLDRLAAESVADWARYTLGVVDQFRRNELPLGGFEAEISSTLPMGAGLSSSASLENAAGLFLLQAFGGKLNPLQIAQFSQMAEHDFVGVRCGLLDQIASLMSKKGEATFIDCRTFAVCHVPLSDHVSFVLAQSGVKHELVAGEYNERRSDCEAAAHALGVKALRDVTSDMLLSRQSELSDRIFRRARHIVGENERVLAGCELLEHGDLTKFGQLMFESHESSRVNFENSCPELDHLVAVAKKTPGVYGARLSGGGFGGATINLVKRDAVEKVVETLTAAALETKCIVTTAADGALAYAEHHPAS
jgi:galactokinase